MIQRNQETICAARNFSDCPVVIPAKAGTRGEHRDVLGFEERGIHRQYEACIPAFAGMTTRFFVAIYQRDSRGVRR
jgi:hypothetical protein